MHDSRLLTRVVQSWGAGLLGGDEAAVRHCLAAAELARASGATLSESIAHSLALAACMAAHPTFGQERMAGEGSGSDAVADVASPN